MLITDITDVCRLCLHKESLVYVFAEKFTEDMKIAIHQATGVEMLTSDVISQKVCKKCMQIAIRIHQFRLKSQQSDQRLKEKLKEYIKKSQLKISTSDNDVKSEDVPEQKESKPETSFTKIHPTVTRLFRAHPTIKLPNIVLKSDIDPCVSMQMDEVETYFRKHNLDIQKQYRVALKSMVSQRSPPGPSSQKKISDEKKAPVLENIQIRNSENSYKPVVSPINIKLNDTKSSYAIIHKVIKDNIAKLQAEYEGKDIPVLKRKEERNDRRSSSDEPSFKKRKTSESESVSNKKPAFVQSLGLAPTGKQKSDEQSSQLSVETKQVSLHICDICNSVQYHSRDLKRHQLKHLRCQFCKSRFKTMEQKIEHIEKSCVIKKTMNDLPDVDLVKVELDMRIRRKYPAAFVDLPIPDSEKSVTPEPQSVISKVLESPKRQRKFSELPQLHYITTERESAAPPKIHETAEKPSSNVIEIDCDEDDSRAKQMPKKDAQVPSTSASPKSQMLKPTNAVPSVIQETKNALPASSIVRPDIRIKNSYILESIDPKVGEVQVVKDLLKHYRAFQTDIDKQVQTDLTTDSSIVTSTKDLSTEFKNLKHQLLVFKIPVVIKKGSFKVFYNYQQEPKTTRKLSLWNDLTPIDVKRPKKMPDVNATLANKDSVTSNHSSTATLPTLTRNPNHHSKAVDAAAAVSRSVLKSTQPTPQPSTSMASTLPLSSVPVQKSVPVKKVYNTTSQPTSVEKVRPQNSLLTFQSTLPVHKTVPVSSGPVQNSVPVIQASNTTTQPTIVENLRPQNSLLTFQSSLPVPKTAPAVTTTHLVTSFPTAVYSNNNSFSVAPVASLPSYSTALAITSIPASSTVQQSVISTPAMSINNSNGAVYNVANSTYNVQYSTSANAVNNYLTTPSNSVTSFVASTNTVAATATIANAAAAIPLPGIIRVKSVWELK